MRGNAVEIPFLIVLITLFSFCFYFRNIMYFLIKCQHDILNYNAEKKHKFYSQLKFYNVCSKCWIIQLNHIKSYKLNALQFFHFQCLPMIFQLNFHIRPHKQLRFAIPPIGSRRVRVRTFDVVKIKLNNKKIWNNWSFKRDNRYLLYVN